jgi:hypothetical protein
LALDQMLATGSLAGRIGDLAALEPWTGQDLRGSVDLDARFEASDGRRMRVSISRWTNWGDSAHSACQGEATSRT